MNQPTDEQLRDWAYYLEYDSADANKVPPRPGTNFPHYYEDEHNEIIAAMCRELRELRSTARRVRLTVLSSAHRITDSNGTTGVALERLLDAIGARE